MSTKKHIIFPKIQQFRNVVGAINRKTTYTGLDSEGNAMYNNGILKPTLTFKGTVKLHGTNASVCFNYEDGFWVQSRKGIITVEKDNAGFAWFAESNKVEFLKLFAKIIENNVIGKKTITIYGEWAGKGIQKSVGISQLFKAFYIFGVKISDLNDLESTAYWIDSSDLRHEDSGIYNVEDYKTYQVDVDFNMPQLSQNIFAEITQEVEKECPISEAFGIKGGLGEGVVWTTEYKGDRYIFKVKGDKHSVSKVKKLASVDVEKLKSIESFVEYAVTENRFNQAIENVFGQSEIDIKKMGDLIRWVINDVIAEEMDTMVKNGLDSKDVNKYISTRTREMFFKLPV